MGYAAKRFRKTEVSRLLREAGEFLKEAGKKLVRAAEAQANLEQALAKVKEAEKIARPTMAEPRSGLPAELRRALAREAGHLETLLGRVRAWPLSKDERLLTRVQRNRERSV